VATERKAPRVHVDAVSEARRLRGSVNLEPADPRRWSAIVAAVDGSVELRVAEPPRRGLRRADTSRLEEHGFVRAHGCWVLPLAAAMSDGEVAARWEAALGADDVHIAYVGAGVPDVPATAPHAAHLEAGLAAVVDGDFNRLHVFGGRPAAPWAFVWDVVGEPGLRVERPHRDDPDNEIDTWHVPRTPEGCRDAAARLVADIEADWPGAGAAPLFIHLLAPHG
jgi:hypothetical protein